MGFGQQLCGFVSKNFLGGNPSKFFDSHGPFAPWFVPRQKATSFEDVEQFLKSGLDETAGFTPEGAVVRALSTRQALYNGVYTFDAAYGQSGSDEIRDKVDEYITKLDLIDQRARKIIEATVAAHGPEISASPNFGLMKQRFHNFRSDLLDAFNPAAADTPPAALLPQTAPRAAPLQL